MRRGGEDRRAFLVRIRPLISGLFNAAHYIAGNSELAEYVTQEAVMSLYVSGSRAGGKAGLREAVLREIRVRALRAVRRGERDEDLRPLPEGVEGDALKILAAQPPELQREVILRYGCGLSTRQAARAMGLTDAQVRTDVRRFLSRAERALPDDLSRWSAERELSLELKRHLYREGGAAFDQAAMLRALEQEAERVKMPRRIVRRGLSFALTALAALLCAALFWLLAVLMEGPI